MQQELEEFTSKYNVHDESVSYLKISNESQSNISDFMNINAIDESRRQAAARSAEFAGEMDFAGTVEEFKVPSVSVPGGIPIDVIKPWRNCSNIHIILVYFHGGGMVFGSKEGSRPVCKVLCGEFQCTVVNVEYRLAPENKFPACFEDGVNVVRWVIWNKPLLGGNNDSKVGIMGCSAGGTIAATVCQEVKRIAFQVLVYPWLDLRDDMLICDDFASGPVITKDSLTWCADQFVNSPEEKSNKRASPLLCPSFTSLPPTLLLLAEFDPLREQAYEYKRKVKEAGIDIESLMIKGSVHGFFSKVGHFKDLGSKARERLDKFLKKKLGTSWLVSGDKLKVISR